MKSLFSTVMVMFIPEEITWNENNPMRPDNGAALLKTLFWIAVSIISGLMIGQLN